MIIGISGKIGSGKDTVGNIITNLIAMKQCTEEESKVDPWDNNLSNSLYVYPSFPATCGGWEIKKMAAKLKQIVALLTGCRVQDLENQEFKKQHLPECWDRYNVQETLQVNNVSDYIKYMRENPDVVPTDYGMIKAQYGEVKFIVTHPVKRMTYRDMLQLVGTECMRRGLHDNVWVNSMFSDYKQLSPPPFEKYPNWIITDVRFPNEAKAIKDREGILIRINKMQVNAAAPHTLMPVVDSSTHESETALDSYINWDYTILSVKGDLVGLVDQTRAILQKEKIL